MTSSNGNPLLDVRGGQNSDFITVRTTFIVITTKTHVIFYLCPKLMHLIVVWVVVRKVEKDAVFAEMGNFNDHLLFRKE
jgi:hypothetical protein